MLVASCGISPSRSSHTSSHHQLLFGLTLRCVYWYGDVTKEDLQAAIRMVLELKLCIKELTVFLDATSIFVEVLMSFSCSEIVFGSSCFWFLLENDVAFEIRRSIWGETGWKCRIGHLRQPVSMMPPWLVVSIYTIEISDFDLLWYDIQSYTYTVKIMACMKYRKK